jgi:hypothetical protein
MSLLQNSNAIETSAGGYNVNNSLRFRKAGSAYLTRTPSTSSSNSFTYSVWLKRGDLGSDYMSLFATDASNGLAFDITTGALGLYAGSSTRRALTTAVFRDPSAWYHLVYTRNGGQGGTTSVHTIYINNEEVLTYTGNGGTLLSTVSHEIGYGGSSYYFDGYMAEVQLIDGQVLSPSSFAETDTTTGVWKPKKYTGTYGTNGFYLNFSDIALTSGSNSGLGKDFSGNGNYWTTTNISVTAGTTYDAMTDSPTNTSATVGNYAIINPLATTGVTNVASNGNLRTNSVERRMYSSIGVSSGKWYFEYTVVSTNIILGIGNNLAIQGNNYTGILAYSNSGVKYNGATTSAYGASYTANDVIGVALNMDAGTLEFYKNNVSQGVAFTGLSGIYYASPITGSSGACFVNFGQQPFVYTPPTGHLAINTYNLADSTIKKGGSYMDATTYTGTGSTLAVTNAEAFKPDLVWFKDRSSTNVGHRLSNSISGAGLSLYSNLTNAETALTDPYVTAFNSNGFSTTTTNGVTYVGWQWQAGQGTNTTNTSGSITSTVSVNTTAGFSVVTYTGTGANATVGHGLGVAPSMVIVKNRGSAVAWTAWHSGIAGTQYLVLNTTAAAATGATWWDSTTPTSSVFSVGTSTSTNASTNTYVAYCWAEIEGFSKFGTYTGNGNANGTFIYTGFRPRFILVKRSNSTGDWYMWDTSRNTSNVVNSNLLANTFAGETTATAVDIVSNGFKIRNTTAGFNTNNGIYIYAAFAENPFKNSLAR